jgi:hypothetical protein
MTAWSHDKVFEKELEGCIRCIWLCGCHVFFLIQAVGDGEVDYRVRMYGRHIAVQFKSSTYRLPISVLDPSSKSCVTIKY